VHWHAAFLPTSADGDRTVTVARVDPPESSATR